MPTATATAPGPAAPGGPGARRWAGVGGWLGTAARVLLAAVWAYAGGSKIGDPAASVRAVRGYRILPEWLAKAVGYGLPFLELALAVLLLAGVATRLAALVSAALLAVFLAGIVAAAARGLQIECGCFGGGGQLGAGRRTTYTLEILRDAALLAVSLALVRWPRSRLSGDDVVRAGAAGAVGAQEGRVGPRRTKEAQRRLAELAERRRREGERRVLLVSAACGVVLLAVTGIGIGAQAARAGGTASGPTPQAVSFDTGVKVGSGHPDVLVRVFEDFQCPFCRQFELQADPVVRQYTQGSGSRVQVQYFVIAFLDRASKNRYASRAANAGYCAADAGVFPAFHALLYANQPAEKSAGPDDDQLVAFGRQAGATSDTFASCVRTEKYRSFVSDVTENASQSGINQTPTVLVNGTALASPTGDALRSAIAAKLG